MYICIYCDKVSFAASHWLYKEANALVERSSSNLARFHLLEDKLMILDEESRKQCLLEGRNLAIKRRLHHLQSDMEMYFLSIKRKEVLIESSANMLMYLKRCDLT